MAKKRQPANTASARKLADDWERLKAKWSSLPPMAITRSSKSHRKRDPADDVLILHQPEPREGATMTVKMLKSRTTPGGSTAPATQMVYTGDKMLGVATMHKSNMVPVFSTDDAESIAKMRR